MSKILHSGTAVSGTPQRVSIAVHNPRITAVNLVAGRVIVTCSNGTYDGQVTMLFADPVAVEVFADQLVQSLRQLQSARPSDE